MAASGEERLLTLFADVHYFFSDPSPRPTQHRFDKESYVYLYRDAANKRGRLEIANHAGTPEQDAFTGYLDSSTIVQSHKHPTLCTVIVDGAKSLSRQTSPPGASEHHWRLPSTDPRDEGRYLFRLHTIDLYFWTDNDALAFIEGAGSALRREQLNVDEPPAPASRAEVSSPVVQKLENIAISDPAYRNGQTRDSRSTAYGAVPPPPAPQDRKQERGESSPEGRKEEKPQDSAAFVPLAYNPAAPPAPEKIKHREKTPPPPDFEGGTGLGAAAKHDYVPAQAQSPPPPSGYIPQSFSSPSPQYAPTSPPYSPQPTGYSTAPPSTTPSYVPMSPAPPSSSMSSYPRTSTAPTAPVPSFQQSSFQDPSQQFYQPGTKPLDSPAAQILGPGYLSHPAQPVQHLQPQYADYLASRPTPSPSQQQPPTGGYSDYSYDQPPSRHHHHRQSQEDSSDIHNQVYRPTEEEASHSKPKKSSKSSSRPNGIEQKADRIETKVNSFLKRLEKKIG